MNESEQGRAAPPVDRRPFFLARFADSLVARRAQGRIYYGWYIVAVVFMVGIATVGFNGPFFGIFLKPMSQEFGWTRATTTGAVTIGTLIAASTGLLLGWVLDRYGPRWMMAVGCVVLGAAYYGLSRVNTLVVFYLVYAVGRSVMQSALGRGMMNALVSKWFVRRRAKALGFAILGSSIGGVILAPLAQAIIDNYGWRQAWAFFGLLTWSLVMLPWLLLRRLPEDLGLLPDGDARDDGTSFSLEPAAFSPIATETIRQKGNSSPHRSEAFVEETSLTLREAVRTTSFWLLCLMVGINTMSTTGVTFHMVPHFTDVGISKAAAAATISVFTLTQIPSIFLWGFWAERLGAKQTLLGVLLTLALGVFLVARAHAPATAYLGAGVFGVGIAGYILVVDVVWADFFGRAHLGGIRGVSLVFQLVGNASGSLIAALLYDWRGNYDFAFNFIMVVFLVSSVVLLLARKPQPKTT